MIRPEPPVICFGIQNVKTLIFVITAVFSTAVFAQLSDSDSVPYKRDRYNVTGISPTDRVFERDINNQQGVSLTANDYVYEALNVIADFDGDYDDDIAFFRKLDTDHYILVVISHYDWRISWDTRETVLAEFDHDVSGTQIWRLAPRFISTNCSEDNTVSPNIPFTTDLKLANSGSIALDRFAIQVIHHRSNPKWENWNAIFFWDDDDGEYKTTCRL